MRSALQSVRAAVQRLDAAFDAEGTLPALGLFRLALALVASAHLAPFVESALDGRYYADAFHVPYVTALPEPSLPVYRGALGLACLALACMGLGLFTRVATLVAFALVTWNFFLSQTHYHHNAAFLVTMLFCACLLPLGEHASLDAALRARRGIAAEPYPLWPLFLTRVLVATPYFASGLSKLLDPDWFSGLVTWDRVVRFHEVALADGIPEWALAIAERRSFHVVVAKLAVFTELFIAFGYAWRRTRPFSVGLAVVFHLAIELTLEVQVFSLLGLAVQLVWLPPRLAERSESEAA